ncbi:Acid extracellular protease [Yarrowia sp. B02]|nr:Acid extracellular protease [Yarrowia sp. B02]
MQFSLATITTLLAFVAAAPSTPGFVHAPIKKQTLSQAQSKIPNFASSGPITTELYNEVNAYEVDITLGGQKISASIDTGSEILWVWNSNSKACQVDEQDCEQEGTYTPSKSSTGKNTGVPFDITYGLGHASGYLYKDIAEIGGATAPGFKFGVNTGYISDGGFQMVFGIGVNSDAESSISAQLQKAGAIKRNLYGMSFSEAENAGTDKDNSEITFGAINTGRYEGSLKTVPRVKTSGLQHFSVSASGKFGDVELFKDDIVILDSGTTLTYLKTDAYNAFLGGLQDSGISLENYQGGWQGYPCSKNSEINFTYNFSGKEIKVTGHDLAIPASMINPNVDDSVCFIGIDDGGDMNLFGDTFLRATYSVYDLERDEVSIAQVAHGKPDNYVVITGDVPN